MRYLKNAERLAPSYLAPKLKTSVYLEKVLNEPDSQMNPWSEKTLKIKG